MPAWKQFVDCDNYIYVLHPEFGKPYCFPCLQGGTRVPLSRQEQLDECGRKVYVCVRPEKHRIVVRQLWKRRASRADA